VKVYENRCKYKVCLVLSGEIQVNQNDNKTRCLILGHTGSAITKFISQSILSFCPKLKVSIDYHIEINSEFLKTLFTKQFLLHLAAESKYQQALSFDGKGKR
jgi:hypothetical protein